MPDCTVFSTEPDWEEFFRAASRTVAMDWSGTPLPFAFSFAFGISPERFYFGAAGKCRPFSKPGSTHGEFTERLWEFDVIELFLEDDDTDAYQEFNLAPNGAWWTQLFTGYRSPATETAAPSAVDIYSESNDFEFRSGLRMRRDDLLVQCRFGADSRANLSAIFGKEKRVFISVHTAPDSKPDFHLGSVFLPLVLSTPDALGR